MIEPISSSEVTQAQLDALTARLSVLETAYSPTEGQAITLINSSQDMAVQLTPAADRNAISITLPSEASTRVGQRVFIRSTRSISQMTVIGQGSTVVDNFLVMFSPGDCVVFFKSKANVWSRVV